MHPKVGPLVEQEVVDLVLKALEQESRGGRVMALNWRKAGLLHVERRAPLTTATGKVLHLTQERHASSVSGQLR